MFASDRIQYFSAEIKTYFDKYVILGKLSAFLPDFYVFRRNGGNLILHSEHASLVDAEHLVHSLLA